MALFGRKKEVAEEAPAEETPTLPEGPQVDEHGRRRVSDHADYLLSLVEPLKPFGMTLLEAWDQVMCEDINAMVNVPATSTAKTAGFAVRATDLVNDDGALVPLRLVPLAAELPPLAAMELMAGEPLPQGATAVLPREFAQVEDNAGFQTLHLLDRVAEGDYIRPAGDHLAAGTRLLSEGEVLGDRGIGLLAGAGIDKVMVRPRPRVVVVASGAELATQPGEPSDANSFMIAAAAKAAGATVFRVAVHTDDPVQLKQAISDQLIRADLIISTTTGSREDYEAVAGVLAELGLVDSVEVAMSPGRTQTFGLIGVERVPMVMLPGNSVSAYVSFHAFVWPLIRKLMGAPTNRRQVRAITQHALRSEVGVMHILRGETFSESNVRGVERVTDPHALSELARSNALILLDEETELVRAGEAVQCWLLDEE